MPHRNTLINTVHNNNKSYQKGERVSDDGMSIVHTSNQNTNSVQSN